MTILVPLQPEKTGQEGCLLARKNAARRIRRNKCIVEVVPQFEGYGLQFEGYGL